MFFFFFFINLHSHKQQGERKHCIFCTTGASLWKWQHVSLGERWRQQQQQRDGKERKEWFRINLAPRQHNSHAQIAFKYMWASFHSRYNVSRWLRLVWCRTTTAGTERRWHFSQPASMISPPNSRECKFMCAQDGAVAPDSILFRPSAGEVVGPN